MSSVSSSFDDDLTDLTDLESVRSSCFDEPRETPTPQILEKMRSKKTQLQEAIMEMGKTESIEDAALKTENEGLKATILRLKKEMEMLRSGETDEVEEESILSSIQGSWSIVSSVGMTPFLNKWKMSRNLRYSVYPALFETGVCHFQYDRNREILKMKESIGTQEFNESESRLGKEVTVDGLTFCSTVQKNALVTVYFKDSEEIGKMKRFVKDGKLHIVSKRFGVKCERVYERFEEGRSSQKVADLENELSKKDAKIAQQTKIIETFAERNEALETKNEELFLKNRCLLEQNRVTTELLEDKLTTVEALENQVTLLIAERSKLQRTLEAQERMTTDFTNLYQEANKKLWNAEATKKALEAVKIDAEKWKKEADLKNSELEALKESLAFPIPIQDKLLGSWKLYDTTFGYDLFFCAKVNVKKDGSYYLETNSGSNGLTGTFSWKLDSPFLFKSSGDPNMSRSYIKDDKVITELYNDMNCQSWKSSILREVTNGILIVTRKTKNEESVWAKYKRDE